MLLYGRNFYLVCTGDVVTGGIIARKRLAPRILWYCIKDGSIQMTHLLIDKE
jgi:hypothetical protein